MWGFALVLILSDLVFCSYPSFEASHRMRILMLPADMRVGSVIYRLRATDPDFDYPLRFDVVDSVGRSVIRIDSLPCTPTHTYCQGNVFLTRRLEPDRVYDMILSVRDSTGQETKVDATIKATRATTHFEDAFPYVPSLLMVPEDAMLGSSLAFVLARRGRPNTELEMWGSENFRLYQTGGTRDVVNATIKLTAELDFEERTMYMLTIYALEPWTVEREDTRNVAGFQLPVVVTDVQDMPPVFTQVPPVTTLSSRLNVGDKILQLQAQDGDRGASRQIRYGLVSEKNPFVTFFNISEKTGEIILAKPIKELQIISRSHQPIILTVMAEEVKMDLREPPALTATTTVALLLENDVANSPPKFMNQEYVARLRENAPQGTALLFGPSYSTTIEDLDTGQEGVFSLQLVHDNGTFEVSPSVAEGKTNFVIRVRNNKLLDFEQRSSVSFQIVTTELTGGTTGRNSTANVTVYLDDENDNAPVFSHARYEATLPENVTADTLVAQVSATDADSGSFGRVYFTNILGYLNHSLAMDSVTGIILIATNNHGFDREAAAEYKFTVEARDMEGVGNKATVPLVIKLLDVNDETPEFERQVYEFILQPGLRNFTSRAYVKAFDKDAEPPNNVVRYEIMSGNIDGKFHLNEVTGELTIRGRLGRRRDGSNHNNNWGEAASMQRQRVGRLTASTTKSPKRSGRDLVVKPSSGKVLEKQIDYDYDGFAENRADDTLDSVIVLNIRAYDLGIPHRWQRAYVRIYPPESRARNMNFIVAGSRPDRRATEELLKAITGGRVIIQEVKPYTGREQGTDLTSNDSNKEKSVVTATVFYEGNSVVDLQQVEARLSGNKTQALVEQTVQEYRSENRVLFWLLVLLLILITIFAVLLLLCCLWQGCLVCPCLEINNKKTVVAPAEDNVKFIMKERTVGTETKGVQAAHYERREAWSAHDDGRTVHMPTRVYTRSYREDDHRRRDSMDSFYGPMAARTRHPTVLVEDVEGHGDSRMYRTIQNEKHHKYYDSHSRRRSPETPRFPRKHSPPREVNFHQSHSPRRPNSDYEQRSRPDERSRKEEKDYYLEKERKRSGGSHRSLERSLAQGDDDNDDLSVYKEDIIYRQASPKERSSIKNAAVDAIDAVRITQADKGLSPPHDLNPVDSDSIRRHEVERGSLAREWEGHEEEIADREQLYIRDGNAEILRLLTRGPREQRPHTLVQDSGKELLMQRFMEDQGGGDAAALLREFLAQDYLSRVVYHETQSLPAQVEMSTQTACEASTQTDEPALLRPPLRNARSDNELSDDDSMPKKGWRRRRANIKTPIMEEGESLASGDYPQADTRPAMFALPSSGIPSASNTVTYTENKSSILRRRKVREKEDESSGDDESIRAISKSSRPSRIRDRRDTPATIQIRADSLNRLYRALKDLQRAGSLSELTHSEEDKPLDKVGMYKRLKDLSSTTTGSSNSKEAEDASKMANSQRKSKYMDWYKNIPNNSNGGSKLRKPTRRKEEDLDSGIALSSLLGNKKSKIEKKSVFTIAYDDVQTKNIRPDTNSSQKL